MYLDNRIYCCKSRTFRRLYRAAGPESAGMGIAFLHLPEMGAVEGKDKDVQKFLYQEKQYFFLESLKMRRLTRPSVPGDLQGYRIKREKIYPEA